MNKITRFFCLAFCFAIGLSFAQTKQKVHPNSDNLFGTELKPYNQDFYNRTGVVRCLSDEMNERRGYDQAAFEKWLAPLVEETKQRMAQERNQDFESTYVYQLPIIFHVIYNNEAVGTGPNLDALYINEQITQLNLDFRNLAGAATGPWAGRDLDSRIEFYAATEDPSGNTLAEPGIVRHSGYTNQDYDAVIKPATIWDRNRYVNVWTGALGGGLLGYAQFPDNSTLPGMPGGAGGAANTDGVVCTYTSIGSVTTPYPGGAPYNAGRTLTHEIGHWIGLRHIWGDGGCGVDDFCEDTPLQGTSSGGCPTTQDSCAGDADRDMVENYMDYSNDTCMNIFTKDQVIRMITVLQNSPGRVTLVSEPVVSFKGSSTAMTEGTNCNFTDVQVEIMIHKQASANADVTVSVTGGTAVENSDFEFLSNTVTIPSGSTTSQFVTLRVYNDSFFEGEEAIDLSLALNANGGDAVIGEDTYKVVINDDDPDPATGSPSAIFSDDFESGLGNWTVTTAGTDAGFVVGDNAAFATTDGGFFSSDDGNTTNYVFINDDGGCGASAPGCNYADERIAMSTSLDLSGLVNVVVNFDYVHDNQYVTGEEARLEVSTDNGATWTSVETINANGGPSAIPFSNIDIDASAFAGQSNVRFSIYYTDNNGWGQGFIFDNFSVNTVLDRQVQTVVNSGSTEAEVLLTPNGGANAFDTASTNIMADVVVTNATDFGCTTINVSRDGTSGQSYNGSVAPALVMDKTFDIDPDTVSPGGASTISFYFTETELAGWEAATSDSRNNLRILKNDGTSTEEVSATLAPFGSDWKLTGDFTTGINGTYYFGNLAFLSTSDFEFDAFAMYPNPANDEITISFNTTADVAVSIYDLRGRKVLTNTFEANGTFNQTLNVSALAPSMYLVNITSGSNSMTKKVIIK